MNKIKSLFSLLAILGVVNSGALAAPQNQWKQGDPSAEEQYALEQLNEARRDRVAFAQGYFGQMNSDAVVRAYVAEISGVPVDARGQWAKDQIALVRACAAKALAAAEQWPETHAVSFAPLALYPAFQQQAAFRSGLTKVPLFESPPYRPLPFNIPAIPEIAFSLPNNGVISGYVPAAYFNGPNATGGTANFGPINGTFGETSIGHFYASYVGVKELLMGWLTRADLNLQGDTIDTAALGHTRMAGINVRGLEDGARVFTLFKVSSEYLSQSDLPYGQVETAFLTGVVYQDKNANGAYDMGEGLAGAKITPDRGDWFAVSSASGGYSIPVQTNSGSYKLSITSGRLSGRAKAITVQDENVKVDWVLEADPAIVPPQVAVAASSGNSQFTGFSARGLVESGANPLAADFAIAGGKPGERKLLLIRGVGPSLQTGFGISNAVASTTLDILDGHGAKLNSNTSWSSTWDMGEAVARAAVTVGTFPLTSQNDSALLVEVSDGSYTAMLRPPFSLPWPNQTNGVGLIEIYDLTPTMGGKLTNLTVSGRVGPGQQQLIVGCTVAGSGSKQVLWRGVGPELAKSFDVLGALRDPILTVHESSGAVLAVNDDWGVSPQTVQIRELSHALSAFRLDEKGADAAILQVVPAGSYTAAITAKSGTTPFGVAVVEVFEAP